MMSSRQTREQISGLHGMQEHDSAQTREPSRGVPAHQRVEVGDQPVGDGLDVVLGGAGMQVAGGWEGAVAGQQQRHRHRHLLCTLGWRHAQRANHVGQPADRVCGCSSQCMKPLLLEPPLEMLHICA